MKVALMFYGNLPEQGGVGQNLECLIKTFKTKKEKLFFFNPFYKNSNTINILRRTKIGIPNILLDLVKRQSLRLFLTFTCKLIREKRTSFTDKLRILLYLIIKPKILNNSINNIIKIYPHLKRINFDIFLGGTATADVLVICFILSRIFNKRIISLAYGNEFLVHTRYSLRTVFFQNIDLLILGTQTLKEIIKNVHHLSEKRLKVIHYGLIPHEYVISQSKEELRKEFRIPIDTFVLLSVGRHVSRKKFDLVIKAIEIIKKQEPEINIRYFLIGEGEETKNLRNLVKSLNLEDVIKFLGYVDKDIRNKFYKLSDIFLMPSIVEPESIEGFGIVFLEANYFKLPVIGTYSGGIVEAIKDNETGLLVEENSIDDLVNKIYFLYKNKEIRKNMGEKGWQRVIESFNWDYLANEYINAFKDLITSSKK
ncbi:MAG: glycosyltransferase family 4 protein [Promethearchaeota archaeon]